MPVTDIPVRIVSLHVHPVKSCHRIDVDAARLGARGLLGDREWMVTSPDGRFLTQRTLPALALIRPCVEGDRLLLQHPALPSLVLPAAGAADWARRTVRIWDDDVDARVAGDEAGRWLGAALGQPALLVRADARTRRQPSGPWRGEREAFVNFPDAYPLLVCNDASLADLNARLDAPLPMTRFRPNLVLAGLQAWQEDAVAELRFGAVRLPLVKACTRCATTTIDQESGESAGNPLPVLKAFRYDRALRGVTFGQNALLAAGEGEVLRAGDQGIATLR